MIELCHKWCWCCIFASGGLRLLWLVSCSRVGQEETGLLELSAFRHICCAHTRHLNVSSPWRSVMQSIRFKSCNTANDTAYYNSAIKMPINASHKHYCTFRLQNNDSSFSVVFRASMASVPAEGADHFFCHAIKVYLFLLSGHLTKTLY